MFPDIKGHWAEKDIERMTKAGILAGYPDGTFKSEQHPTRAELAAFGARLTFKMCLMDGVLSSILPAVFIVYRNDGGLGTGFYITDKGNFITAKHIVTGATNFTVIDDTQENRTARLIAVSPSHDLALLKVDSTPPAVLKVAADDAIYEGKHIAVIGAPRGYNDSITQGVVSYPKRTSNPVSDVLDVFQTDAAVNPGNSGGPAVDGNGDVIGVAVWKYSDVSIDNMAFCVRCDVIRQFCKQNGVIL